MPADTRDRAGCGSEHLMELQVFLLTAGQLDQMGFKHSFQHKRFCEVRHILYLQEVQDDIVD